MDHCIFCNSFREDLHHMLVVCPKYFLIKLKYFPDINEDVVQELDWKNVLSSNNVTIINNFIDMFVEMFSLYFIVLYYFVWF